MRHALLVSLLLFATAEFAQSADVWPSILGRTTPTIDANLVLTWQVEVINNGPDAAREVSVTGSTVPPLDTVCSPASVDALAPGPPSLVVFQCTTQPFGKDGFITLYARASAANDSNPANNDALPTTLRAVSGPDLFIGVGARTIIDPGLPFEIALSCFNGSIDVPATNVMATVILPPQVRVLKLPDNCTEAGQIVTCSEGTVPPNKLSVDAPDVVFTAVADDSTNGQILHIVGDASTPDKPGGSHLDVPSRVFRTFFVTQPTGEALGAAVDEANLNCTDEYPCKVAFRLGAPPASGYFTLEPVAALPMVTGKNISIDGTTQTRLTGDTNPNGPEIFIDGRNSSDEDAIVIDAPCGFEVAGLAIGNFSNAAVTMITGLTPGDQLSCQSFSFTRTLRDSYLGVDPSGTQPPPNGRGVVLTAGAVVTNNVIGANRHSGIWIGAGSAVISGNRIGLDIHNAPLGNSASGIYAGPNTFDVDIHGNYVAFNHDFGIAIDRNARYVGVGPNSIFANWQLGIDIGLDGPTPDRDVPAPVVLSAQYDPATDTTLLTVSSHERASAGLAMFLPTLTMYASDAPHPSGYGDGQYYLGSVNFDSTKGNVVFAAAGDWRGKWVSATVTRNEFTDALFPRVPKSTSELSHAVEVQ